MIPLWTTQEVNSCYYENFFLGLQPFNLEIRFAVAMTSTQHKIFDSQCLSFGQINPNISIFFLSPTTPSKTILLSKPCFLLPANSVPSVLKVPIWNQLLNISGFRFGATYFSKKIKDALKGRKAPFIFQGIYLETCFDHFWLPFWELIFKDPETSPFSISIFPF